MSDLIFSDELEMDYSKKGERFRSTKEWILNNTDIWNKATAMTKEGTFELLKGGQRVYAVSIATGKNGRKMIPAEDILDENSKIFVENLIEGKEILIKLKKGPGVLTCAECYKHDAFGNIWANEGIITVTCRHCGYIQNIDPVGDIYDGELGSNGVGWQADLDEENKLRDIELPIGTKITIENWENSDIEIEVISEERASDIIDSKRGINDGYEPYGAFIFYEERTEWNAIDNRTHDAWMPDETGTPGEMLSWISGDFYKIKSITFPKKDGE